MTPITADIKVSDMLAMRESGMSNKEIADALSICQKTVQRYIGTLHPHRRRSKVADDRPDDNPPVKSFADKCQEVLDRQAGKPFVQFEIVSNVQTFKGADCTYVVDALGKKVELSDGLVIGALDAKQLAQLIAELEVIRGKIA